MVSNYHNPIIRRDKRIKSLRIIGNDYRGVQRTETPNCTKHTKTPKRVTVSIDLASGRYEGEAKLVDPKRLIVQFPWEGNKNHQCWICEREVVNWMGNEKFCDWGNK